MFHEAEMPQCGLINKIKYSEKILNDFSGSFVGVKNSNILFI